MPKDVVLGVPLTTIIGQSEAYIENYRGILEYTDKLIRVQTKLGKIHICGRGLQIEHYTNDDMKITGHISMIEYHEGGRQCLFRYFVILLDI
jgi:sporulation protein YqfC